MRSAVVTILDGYAQNRNSRHAQRMQRYLVAFADDHRVYGEQEGVLHLFVNDHAPLLVLNNSIAYGAGGRSVVFIGHAPHFL